MAHSTPAQTATASSTASGNGTSSSYDSSSDGQAKTVASTILKRHVDQRQRFDSADYALIQSAAGTANSQHQQQQRRHRTPDEQEPEPEAMKTAPPAPSRLAIDALSLNRSATTGSNSVYPQQHVRRIRLQRFDSADWVMDAIATSKAACLSPRSSLRSSSSAAATPSTQAAVAKLILDRHAYTTCHFVTTPVDKHQRCAEKA
ncbi:Translation elongation factor p [Globisporangium polare]